MIRSAIAILATAALAFGLLACTAEQPSTETTAGASAPIAQVGSTDFDASVLQAARPVIVDFYADWCAPCKAQEPGLAKVSQEFAGSIATYKLDIEAAPDIAERYAITSIPALLVFENGELAQRAVGYHAEAELRELYRDVAR